MPIQAPNYLLFASDLSDVKRIYFDSFLVTEVREVQQDVIQINYTLGAPLVDVFGPQPAKLAVKVTVPDTGPYFSRTEARGYLGESLTTLRALYERYLRATAAGGFADPSIRGRVEFSFKGRVARGPLISMSFDLKGADDTVAEVGFAMFVQRGFFDFAVRSAA